jgi:lipopolysaccharide transport system ATP-binding protein
MSDSSTRPASEIAVRVTRLGKYYPVYRAPNDRLKQFWVPRVKRMFGLASTPYHSEFWALRDINIEIRRGETVGIIGRNGAGKSTLLQIISGTLTPSVGEAETHGRVAALLELGAGFNPEFTGRENVYLNAAILGMTETEISARFDEIATFADIGVFMEQPVKTYSSGMYVRLAFAVQACIDPEILIVDEALSVGDIGFQYKCFKRMEALREQGVTILMVTHSTGSVLEYADRCIVLDGGRVTHDTRDVLAAVLAYEKGMLEAPTIRRLEGVPSNDDDHVHTLVQLRAKQEAEKETSLGEKRFGSGRAIIERVVVQNAAGTDFSDHPILKPGKDVVFKFRVLAAEAISNVVLGVSISRNQGVDIWGDNNLAAGQAFNLHAGENLIEYKVALPVSSGEYLVHCGLACLAGVEREELDQRRPVAKIRFWSTRQQVGVVHAPIQVLRGTETIK